MWKTSLILIQIEDKLKAESIQNHEQIKKRKNKLSHNKIQSTNTSENTTHLVVLTLNTFNDFCECLNLCHKLAAQLTTEDTRGR